MNPSEPVPAGAVLPGVVTDIIARASLPGFERWRDQVARTGGCADPIHLVGRSTSADARTGEIVDDYDTASEPTGRLLVACGNRRATVCPSCSAVYQADTYQLVRAGLLGGKGTPEQVQGHPRVFATLTAPSFGPVHTRREHDGRVLACRPRRQGGHCEHGEPDACAQRHASDDPQLGEPICPRCYDYPGAVLWQAHTGHLWHRFVMALRRELADAVSLSRRELAQHARLSYAKVAEFQRRGLVHFHAVIRLDGPDGARTPPPSWAGADLLDTAIRAAAGTVSLVAPGADLVGRRVLRWGDQVDVRPVDELSSGDGPTPGAVAGYIAKYATKGAESAGVADTRIRATADLDLLPVRDHVLRMVGTCWWLGGLGPFAHLRLRQWAHMLGFRGHFSTKSRHYSTTLTALRRARREYRAEQARHASGRVDRSVHVVGEWRYAGRGYRSGEALLAASVANAQGTARATVRDSAGKGAGDAA